MNKVNSCIIIPMSFGFQRTIYSSVESQKGVITRRGLLLYKVNGDSALLVLHGTSLKRDNALLVLSRRYFVKWATNKTPELSKVILVLHTHTREGKWPLTFNVYSPGGGPWTWSTPPCRRTPWAWLGSPSWCRQHPRKWHVPTRARCLAPTDKPG